MRFRLLVAALAVALVCPSLHAQEPPSAASPAPAGAAPEATVAAPAAPPTAAPGAPAAGSSIDPDSAFEAAVPAAARPGADGTIDPIAATEAYLATLTPEARAKSDAYFEGGYWLQLWGFLYGLGIAILLLQGRISAKMRDLARRWTRRGPLQTIFYWVQYLLLTSVLGFPLAVYQGYFREHKYDLATQSFGPWFGDQMKGLAVGLILGGLLMVPLVGVIRRTPRTWWLWGSAVTVAFLIFAAVIAPVYINPIFNTYKPLADAKVRDPILSMARANGIPATEVYEMDASRQTKRISANVSGLLGTERITLNDNLLARCTLPEIQGVMAHEMGHYVLNHVYEGVLEIGLLLVAAFAFVRWTFDWALRRWGAGWGITGIGDLAALPLVVAIFSVFFFLMTPVFNTIIRVNEAEADIFALNASRQPDGFAQVALKLGEYRKLAPGPIEEMVFFDHPSGRSRILMSMRWKAEHPGD